MDGFFDKYGRVIIIAVAICFVLLYLTPMRNVVGSSINGFAGNFANKVGESIGAVKMPDGSDNIKREPSSMLIKANSIYTDDTSLFDRKIPSSATKILFTDEKAPNGVSTVDLTVAQDGDVVGWLDGTTWKVSTQDSKKSIAFNTNSSWMFYRCENIKEIQFNNIDTSQVTTMDNMFRECPNLTSLDLSNFDTSKVTNMNAMFSGCSNLTSLDLSSFDTSNVKDMSAMFSECKNLKELDLSNFNTSNVTTMGFMFEKCLNLKSLNLSGWDTTKVRDMEQMFFDCSKLTSLDLSSFDTSNIKNMHGIFHYCTKLNFVKVRSQTDLEYLKSIDIIGSPNIKFEIA